jgi:tetratricopeptide (TPR) repeat protein
LRDIVAAAPDLGSTWGPVSRLAQALGEIEVAISAAEALVRAYPLDRAARHDLVAILARYGRLHRAQQAAEDLIAIEPASATAHHLLANCLSQLGEGAAAAEGFRQAITLTSDPGLRAIAYLALSETKRFETPDDVDRLSIVDLLSRWPATAPTAHRAALLYAYGKTCDDLDETDRAFAAFAEGATLMSRQQPADLRASQSFVDQVISARQPAMPWASSQIESDRPIFVLGAPRSGTTLVEQILVSHSQVADGAEINLFRAAAIPIGGFDPQTIDTFARRDPDGFRRIGTAYLDLVGQRFGPAGRIVDKTLNHSRYLGLIHHVLPRARFIWLRRDPGAVAWSCFRTWFAEGMEWSWSLEGIASHLRDEDRLHAHWTAVSGDAILTVPYEALVQDTASWISRILSHVGLAPEAEVQRFHQTPRAVTTASYAQVRQPIYASATTTWRRYRQHLAPFFLSYGEN